MRIVQTGLIVLLGFWAFSPALRGEWLFDDIQAVLMNASVHRATGLWKIWFAPLGPDYFPLKDTVQWFQWHLWGKNTLGYHLTNVVLHILSALLLWRLLARLGVRLAWLGGLLFVVHPLTVESVAWICELKNTLSLPLLLMAMLAYLHYDRHGDRISYLRSVAAFIAAMLSKSSVVMFPVIILLYAWWHHGRVRLVDWKRSAIFFGISLVIGVVTMFLQQTVPPGQDPIVSLDPLSRLLCAGLSVAFYLSKCFWPANLTVVYFRWDVQAERPWELFFLLLLALLLVWLVTRRTAWSRNTLFGFLFFLINLVPVLGFIRMTWMRYTWVADHLVYLPMIGLAGLVAAAVSNLYDRYAHKRFFISALVALVVLAMAWQSHSYAKLFQKSVVLWRDNLRLNPQSSLGYNNLAVTLAGHGQPEEAIQWIRLGLKVQPGQSLAYVNWGTSLMELGRIPDAIAVYQVALALRPDDPLAHYQLGTALMQSGQIDQAIEQYRLVIALLPDDVEAHTNLTDAYIETGRLADAIEEGQRAVAIDPDYPDAHYNFGIALGQMDRTTEATDQFTQAARLSPDDPEIRYNLGIALLQEGKTPEALQQLQKALELKPDYAAARSAIERLQNPGH